MTVVAWDGRTLAADKRINFGGLHGSTTKVFRVRDHLVAGTGRAALIAELVAWVESGSQAADFPAAMRDEDKNPSLLVVCPDGTLMQFENTPYPIMLEDKQWAIGSGRDFAMAAMHLGCDARRAVEVACHFEVGCGNGVDALELHADPLPTITP